MKKYKDKKTGEEFGYLIERGGFVILIPVSEWNNISPSEELVWKPDFDDRFEKVE